MAEVLISQLTTETRDGTGVFDALMRSLKAQLEEEYTKGRIKGPEYATVYLGSLTQVLNASLQFLLQQQKTDLEAQMLQAQILQQQAETQHVQAQIALVEQQKQNLLVEHANLLLQQPKLEADTALVVQQTSNLVSEKLQIEQQTTNLAVEHDTMLLQQTKLTADTAVVVQQKLNLVSEQAHTDAQTALVNQQAANAVTENTVLVAQECKLRAEYDLTLEQKLRTVEETGLLAQKKATERAQTVELGVDDNSVIGRQKGLYQAQIDGFTRDAEQKAAKLLVDSWNVRRTTDEATVADTVNRLDDATVGKAVGKMLSGVGL